MVSAQKLSKKLGLITALSELDLEIHPEEFVFLTGPSGAGKTTLFRLILKDLIPSSGEITVLNQSLSQISGKDLVKLRRQIGIIFQDYRLLSDQNIWENIALPLEFRNLPHKDVDLAVHLALDMVGLKDKHDLFPAQLSGGELQRVCIARSIVGKPKILLADEPTGNLDPKTAQSITKLLNDIHTGLKTTVIMATHNPSIVNTHKHRVISLLNGKVVKDVSQGTYD